MWRAAFCLDPSSRAKETDFLNCCRHRFLMISDLWLLCTDAPEKLLRQDVDASLEVFQGQVGWGFEQPGLVEGWSQMSFEVPSNPSHCVIHSQNPLLLQAVGGGGYLQPRAHLSWNHPTALGGHTTIPSPGIRAGPGPPSWAAELWVTCDSS